MSSSQFPLNLPGMDISVKRTQVWKTAIQEAVSGAEQRATFWSAPRFKYQIKFNFLRQSKNGDETATLMQFFDTHRGRFESFLIVDPYDGVTRRVRFDMDEGELEKLFDQTVSGGGKTWTISVKLISVRGTA